jgi:hypothetical protein
MKNSCEGVTNESAILVFIDSLERGQLLRHRLLRERNEGKLTLNSMITIASNYTAADDDTHEYLKASAIQNTGKWSSTAPASAPSAPVSYDEYRDMPCFTNRDASGKCNHTNRNCKFVNDIKADQEAGYKCNRRQQPHGKGKADKDKKSKDGSDMDEDPAPKPAEKAEGGAGTSNPLKNTNKKGAFHTFLGPPHG